MNISLKILFASYFWLTDQFDIALQNGGKKLSKNEWRIFYLNMNYIFLTKAVKTNIKTIDSDLVTLCVDSLGFDYNS